MSLIALDYLCPEHGPFDSLEQRPAPTYIPCPQCGAMSEQQFPSPMLKTTWAVAATTAKSDGPPSPAYMDTSSLADGRPERFQKQREDYFRSWREAQIRRSAS